MATNRLQYVLDLLLGNLIQLNLASDTVNASVPSGNLTLLNLGGAPETPKPSQTLVETSKDLSAGSGIAVIDLGGSQAYSKIVRQTNVDLFRNYAKYSAWVRAAIDYHRRMLGRANYEIIQTDPTIKPSRRDKTVKAAVEALLKHPNQADQSYGVLKEEMIEDYLVVGHGCISLELDRLLNVLSMKIMDAANIGFVKEWDGTDPTMPRFCEFAGKNSTLIKRYLAHQQVFCLVNRPMSYTKTGFSHVEALHKTTMALLSGDDMMIKGILQPTASKLINLGEGVTATQVDQFKRQLLQVKDALAVVGGAKNAQVYSLAATAAEMKILDGQEWFVRQVAAVFGISTAKLKLAVDTSRANTDAMYEDDLEAITGELTRIEELETATFINRWSYLGDINLEFSYPIMHRQDQTEQARIVRLESGQSYASINDARSRTGQKPYEESTFKYANEPIITTPAGPLPLSIWEKSVEQFEKDIGKLPEPTPKPAEDTEAEPTEPDAVAPRSPNNKYFIPRRVSF